MRIRIVAATITLRRKAITLQNLPLLERLYEGRIHIKNKESALKFRWLFRLQVLFFEVHRE